MNSIVFYDPLTSDNGQWTIPEPIREASTYTADGWKIKSNSLQYVECNTPTPSENITVEFTYNGGGDSTRYGSCLEVRFWNGSFDTGIGLAYNKYSNKIQLIGGADKTMTLQQGDKVTYNYNNGVAEMKINNETILTYKYTDKTITGTPIRIYMDYDRWVQLKDFTITDNNTGETQ